MVFEGHGGALWDLLPKEDQKKRIFSHWNKARHYANGIRLQVRLQRMTEQNLKDMNIEDEDNDDEQEE